MELEKVKLKELFSIRKGKKGISEVIFSQGMIRYIQIGDLRNDNNIQYCFHKDQDIVAQKNDIIIAWDGANAGTSNYGLEGAIGSTLALLSLKQNNLYIPYIGKFIQSKFLYLRNNCTGATIPHLSRNILENLEIPLPPMDIQIKIANTLDKAQELIDNKKLQLEKYDKLLQSVFMDMFGDPVTNPMGWEIKKLQEVLYAIDNGWSPKCNENRASLNKWGVLKLSSVTGGKYKQEENKELPTNLEPKPDKEVKEGDLLMTRKNTPELVGDCVYIFETRNNLMMPDLIFRFNTKNIVDKKYLWKLFTNGKYKQKIKELASGSAKSMSNISKAKLQELKIILPPIELQNKFASIVEKVENEKKLCEESLKQMEENFNSIMDKAFKGELF